MGQLPVFSGPDLWAVGQAGKLSTVFVDNSERRVLTQKSLDNILIFSFLSLIYYVKF